MYCTNIELHSVADLVTGHYSGVGFAGVKGSGGPGFGVGPGSEVPVVAPEVGAQTVTVEVIVAVTSLIRGILETFVLYLNILNACSSLTE